MDKPLSVRSTAPVSSPEERFDQAAKRMANLKDQYGPYIIMYLGLKEELDAATDAMKQAILEGRSDPYEGAWGKIKVATRNVREFNVDLLEATLPPGIYDEVVERKVSIKKLDEAIASGEVDRAKVEAATTTRETFYASARLSV